MAEAPTRLSTLEMCRYEMYSTLSEGSPLASGWTMARALRASMAISGWRTSKTSPLLVLMRMLLRLPALLVLLRMLLLLSALLV